MQEQLLQFIWQYSLYRPGELLISSGEQIRIIHPGTINRDAGPDFSMARVMIGSTTLIGNVELHIRTSDWNRHGHDADDAYRRVILHVVFQHDTPAPPGDIPVLQLGPHIPPEVLERYSSLIQTTALLPCAGSLQQVSEITKVSWLGRMLVERWEKKLGQWEEERKRAGGDWHTLFYWRLAANFGFKVNAAPFLLLAQSLPLSVVRRHSSLFQIEALVFGQSGLLTGVFSDEYPKLLQQEYGFLRAKYALTPISGTLWKFLRLRPANFPTIRLAQFAALLHRSLHLFTAVSSRDRLGMLTAAMSVRASEYWDTHYRYDEPIVRATSKTLGADAIHNIIINTVAPLRFLYAHAHGLTRESEEALSLLDEIPAEDNVIIRMWEAHNWKPGHAGTSQALIQLHNEYCATKRCLDCAVGLSIIRSRPHK